MPARYTRGLCLSILDTFCMSAGLFRLKRFKNIRHTSRSIVKQRKERSGRKFHTRLQCLGNEFDCECGKFAHMGLLCSYVLKVLDFIGAKEIPAKHIVKRWTRDACDVLPPHLIQCQKDSIQNNPLSYRHFMMYLHAMDLVRLGDTSIEAYNRLL